MRPLCIDLYCGLGGWAEGFLAEGYDVIGFDIERRPYPGQLVLQDEMHKAADRIRGWLRERLLLKLGEPAVPRGPLRTPGAAPADRPVNERTREVRQRKSRRVHQEK